MTADCLGLFIYRLKTTVKDLNVIVKIVKKGLDCMMKIEKVYETIEKALLDGTRSVGVYFDSKGDIERVDVFPMDEDEEG